MKVIFAVTIFFLLLLSGACKQINRHSQEQQIYIISKQDSILNAQWNETTSPPPLRLFYGDFNFIKGDSNRIYFHQKRYPKRFCGTGIDYTKPDFINLHPNEITIVDSLFIRKFLSDSILYEEKNKHVVIGNIGDTIESKPILQLIKFLYRSGKIRRWNIRRITEEEKVVLFYKERNIDYNPSNIQWTKNFSNEFELPNSK